MDYQMLKSRHRLQREVHHPSLAMGVYRALSWLNRAEQAEDVDGRVRFLWIAFNSTYATDVGEQHRLSEQEYPIREIRQRCRAEKGFGQNVGHTRLFIQM